MVNSEEVAGFQFSIEGAMGTGLGGGSAGAAGFTVTTGNNVVLGFSFEGTNIPPGSGILVEISAEIDADFDIICLDEVVFAGHGGQYLDFESSCYDRP